MRKILAFLNVSKLYVFLSYSALFIGVLNTYFRPKFFSKYFSEQNFAFLTVVYGLTVYISFLDGGISKPIYTSLREKFVNKQEDINSLIKKTLSFYTLLFLIVLAVFTIILFVVYHWYENSLLTVLILLLAINLTINFQVSNFKNVLIAVDEFEFFQKIEFFRRSSNLLALCALIIDPTFILGISLGTIIVIVLLIVVYQKLSLTYKITRYFDLNISHIIDFYKEYFNQSKHFFLFTVFEILIYNSGFIIIPLFYNDFNVIQYGLLITVFTGISIFSRAIVDISIHEMTKKFISNDKKGSKRIFNYSILIALGINILALVGLKILADFVFNIWVGEKYMFTNIMFLALFLMLMGNAIQHASGTLLLSVNNNFKEVKNISFLILVVLILAQLFVVYSKQNLSYFYLITSIIYFFGAISYFYKAQRLYK